MTQYTKVDKEKIRTVLQEEYGINLVKNHSILSGGSENTNFVIETPRDKFVLTICEQKSKKEAEQLAQLLKYLDQNNFVSSKVISTLNDNLLCDIYNKPTMLKAYIEGNIQENCSASIIYSIGIEVAKLHLIPPPNYLQTSLNYGIQSFHEVGLYAKGTAFEVWLNQKKHFIEAYLSDDLPKALIHSDIFPSNVIISEDQSKTIVMDFEEACNYYRIFDIGMSIVGLCREGVTINIQKAKNLLAGYESRINLLPVEKNSLQAFVVYAATAMTFWRHRNFNYINPIPSQFNHYKELQSITNYVAGLSANSFF